jgi:hypothetical protein
MFSSESLTRAGWIPALTMLLVATIMPGCKSKENQALDQTK